jgi:hypothetical protein
VYQSVTNRALSVSGLGWAVGLCGLAQLSAGGTLFEQAAEAPSAVDLPVVVLPRLVLPSGSPERRRHDHLSHEPPAVRIDAAIEPLRL